MPLTQSSAPPSPRGAAALLEVRGLRKAYGSLVAIDGVDLRVSSGEILGLVGKNGAGKSSLIKVLTGAVSPDAGGILLRGQPVTFHGPADARRQGLAFVHQELSLIPSSSVAENLVLGAGYPRRAGRLVHWQRLHRIARELMSRVDMGDVDPRQRVSELSAVQQRQVMIAAALWQEVSVLILDEPTASLSEHEIVTLHRIVRGLAARGTAVLYVSHRLDEVMALADRVVVMRDGAVVNEADPQGIDRTQLVAMISGSAALPRTRRSGRPPAALAPLLKVSAMTSAQVRAPQSFHVSAGEILGIAGMVGSGRTELLRAVYGADPRLSGTVVVGGEPIRRASPAASLRAGLALLSEDRRHAGLIIGFSLSHNVSFASLDELRAVRWLPFPSRPRERSLTQATVSRLGISARGPDDPVVSLSGGNQQKVLLGRWLATRPRVLLLDEPTLGVDVGGKAEIYALLRGLADQGHGLVVVSSEFAELELICDRALVMRDGRIVDELAADEITEPALIHACYEETSV